MTAFGLYLCLAVATATSVLVSLSAHRHIRLVRTATVLLSYGLLAALIVLDPWWRVLTVWSLAGLVTGLICFMIDCAWNRRGRERQAELPHPTNWWLIPLGVLGWPDMLPHALELSLFEHRVIQPPPAS